MWLLTLVLVVDRRCERHGNAVEAPTDLKDAGNSIQQLYLRCFQMKIILLHHRSKWTVCNVSQTEDTGSKENTMNTCLFIKSTDCRMQPCTEAQGVRCCCACPYQKNCVSRCLVPGNRADKEKQQEDCACMDQLTMEGMT